MLVTGDTFHRVSVEKTLLSASAEPARARRRAGFWPVTVTRNGSRRDPLLGRLIIAIDDIKALAEEQMNVILAAARILMHITKALDPAHAHVVYLRVELPQP